jgi:hypothetical protein
MNRKDESKVKEKLMVLNYGPPWQSTTNQAENKITRFLKREGSRHALSSLPCFVSSAIRFGCRR